MSDHVPSGRQLMDQAHQTANEYLIQARHCLDRTFHEGYAEKHPELVAAMVQASAMDFLARSFIEYVTPALLSISTSLDER